MRLNREMNSHRDNHNCIDRRDGNFMAKNKNSPESLDDMGSFCPTEAPFRYTKEFLGSDDADLIRYVTQ
jgi:hypothetical protein